MQKLIAECLGTFTLVFMGCATIIFMVHEVGLLGVAAAFGLTVIGIAYAIGHISGAHLNPAVSLGAVIAGRLSPSEFAGYVIAQCLGAIAAAALLYVLVQSKQGGYDTAANGFAQNGWKDYSVVGAFLFEFIATALFLIVILGSTEEGGAGANAGLAIGFTLVVIHLAGIVVSGSSVNPARSLGPALFAGPEAIGQLWLYILAPCLGAALGGVVHRKFLSNEARGNRKLGDAKPA
ncbi:MIP family channel protein [Ruegeria lacuscaerulensis]|uniref:MIP family channel protein n=1 Tax=Ruegeria lacuscaerulensis TaxID=55218 RepID=UPI001479E6AB|nr:MIP family channel protein [Ruegeria lacuscaerulensis]